MLCPCGSNTLYEDCCLCIIDGKQLAKSPQQLMRSRYSAYAMKNTQYILDTYAKATRVNQSIIEIESAANSCQWIKLNIRQCSKWHNTEQEIRTSLPTVEFDAFYLTDNKVYQLSEKSRFIKEANNAQPSEEQWFYLDGDITRHDQVNTIKRNDRCPCQKNQNIKNKKKFKNCCGL